MNKPEKSEKKSAKTEVPSAKTLAATKLKTNIHVGREPVIKVGPEERQKIG